MPPAVANQPVPAAPTSTNTQGVQTVNPIGAPTPSQQPSAPQNVGLPSPVQNPTFNPSADMQNISNYYQIPQQATLASESAQASGEQGRQQLASTQYQAGVTEQNLKNQLDPSSYTVTQDPGSQYGLKIVNSLGQQVPFSSYINLTGQNPAEVLQQSTNPQAQQFTQAYNNLESLMQAMLAPKSDQQAQIQLGDYFKANPGLEQMTPQQVTQAFMQQYGEFLGQPQQSQPGSQQGISPTFASANSIINQSPYYEMQNYQGVNTPNPISQQLLNEGNGSSSTANSAAQFFGSQMNNGG